ncbi:uncharacterized protein BDW70DRAFT_135654 [Aspergillus foveolatus]|uniref:uncharacterized protein n=1 Tax=Aspergillus foveolatus TaxID=210207 RepID=UPI003CCD1A22
MLYLALLIKNCKRDNQSRPVKHNSIRSKRHNNNKNRYCHQYIPKPMHNKMHQHTVQRLSLFIAIYPEPPG